MSFPPPPTHAGDACWPGVCNNVKECVVHNGYAYRSLARHDPHSQEVIPEREIFTRLTRHGSCAPTPATHGTFALRILGRHSSSSLQMDLPVGPRKVQIVQVFLQDRTDHVQSQTHLHRKEGKHAAAVAWEEMEWAACGPSADRCYMSSYKADADVLLRLRLPYSE